jgi:phospholipid/cholesterol/gamma-HCH transport system substrate-binding protein
MTPMRRRDEILVGLLTTVAVVVLIAGTLWLIRGGLQRGYPLYVRFAWGAGLKQGQPVLFSGVNVGYVDRVDLLDDGGLVTTLRIYKRQRVPTGTMATIVPNGIFGDVAIALRAAAPTSARLAPGDTIPSTEGPAGLSGVFARVDSVGQNLVHLTTALHTELVDKQTIAELRNSARSANAMFQSLAKVVEEQSAELTRTQTALRRVAAAVDSVQIDSAVRDLRAAATNTSRMLADLRTTSARLSALMTKADSGTGTAAKLLNDSTLYADVRALVRQLDSLVADIKANTRKYIKFSIF